MARSSKRSSSQRRQQIAARSASARGQAVETSPKASSVLSADGPREALSPARPAARLPVQVLDDLAEIGRRQRALDRRREALVVEARAAGLSWDRIAVALATVTAEALRRRYRAPLRDHPLP